MPLEPACPPAMPWRLRASQSKGAFPVAIRLLKVRQTLRRAWFALRVLFDSDSADAEELLAWGRRWNRLGHWRLAVKNYRAALARRPDLASAANALAWCLVVIPGRGDAALAVHWARQAVALAPDDTNVRNTLGVALYRAGSIALAAAELEDNAARNTSSVGYDWVFLAMCRQRLGQPDAAQDALVQAQRWRAQSKSLTPDEVVEFRGFLQEAHALLDQSLPDVPSNLFDR